jgi:hypothetical protein
MALDVASLPRDPEVLIGMIVELHDENGRLRVALKTATRAMFSARSEWVRSDAAQLPIGLDDASTTPIEPVAPRPPPRGDFGDQVGSQPRIWRLVAYCPAWTRLRCPHRKAAGRST